MSLSEMQLRLDAPTVGAFQRQLEYIETEVLKPMRPSLDFASGKLVPIETLNQADKLKFTYRIMTAVGAFELARDYTTNLPLVDLLSEEVTQTAYKYTSGYMINEEEVAAVLKNVGLPIEQNKIEAVKEIGDQTLNKLIATGDPQTGMYGFINHPAWLRSYALYPIDSTSTPNQILAALKAPVTSMVTRTNGQEAPDTLLLPYEQYEYAIDARASDNYDKTILKQFLDNNGHVKNIAPVNELKGAGRNGEDVAIFYKRDPRKVKACITEGLRFRNVLPQAFGFIRPAAFYYGGIKAYRPFSVHVVEGI